MSQIFWNLARNSLRAMPDGGTLRVVGAARRRLVPLQVIDTGRGMSEEQRTNLFHPFQSFFDGGTGIGMAIVYRIVQDHGGTAARRQPARAPAPPSPSSCREPPPRERHPGRPRRRPDEPREPAC